MGTDRFRRIEEIFDRALALPRERRSAFLDEACGGDDALRQEVVSLLRADDTAGEFMEKPAIEHGVDTTAPGAAEGQHVGPYRLLRKTGEGGMSEVFLAVRDDDAYQKRVALKIIRHDLDREDLLRRFRTERQILAGLDHPNIATLHDGGTTDDGLPFFVMEYIDGTPIDEYCDGNGLGIPERLDLFRSVCSAVQYAHQNLVVHRDIKASNILVTADGVPKLLDFGIAKLLKPDQFAQQVEYTATWLQPMTPRYASPEQIQGKLVGTPTDVYSLGILLYKLLTGRLPYRLGDRPATEIGQLIVEQEPETPSTAVVRLDTTAPEPSPEEVGHARRTQPHQLQRALQGDLDNIILMAIRKEPQRRYASVEQLAEDIRRYLEGLPVIARKDTFGYRAAKFMRRNAIAVGAAAMIAALLVAFAVTMGIQARRIAVERDQARLERDRAEKVTGFLEEIFGVTDPYEAQGENITAAEILDRGAARVTEELGDQPVVQAALMQTIGNVYRNIGRLDRAEPLVRRALAARRADAGTDAAVLAESLMTLGILRLEAGDHDEAESVLREAVDVQRDAGLESVDLVEAQNYLGVVLRRTGRFDEAEEIYRSSLGIVEELGDLDMLADSKNNLATLSIDQGRFDDGEALLAEALELRRQVYGRSHPLVAQSLSNLGTCIAMQGKYDEAEPMLREALAMYRDVLPEGHPALMECLNNVGKLLQRKGSYDEAERMYSEALTLQRRLVGDMHHKVAHLCANMAELLQARGDLDEAERYAREGLQIRRTVMGEGHPDVGKSYMRLGSLARERNQLAEAEEWFGRGLAVYSAAFPEDHWLLADGRSRLAEVLTAQGRYAEAEEPARAGYEGMLATRGADHPRTLAARERLVKLYDAWGKPAQAGPYRSPDEGD